MKKGFFLWTAVAALSLSSFSCSDDEPGQGGQSDENVKTVTLDANAYDKWTYFSFKTGETVSRDIDCVAGTYSGDLSLSVMGQDQGTVEGLTLEVTRVSADSVGIVLKDFAFGKYGMIGDIRSGASLTLDTTGYALKGGEVITSLEQYNVKASSAGYLTSVGQTIELTITMNLGDMPMPVVAVYRGQVDTALPDETAFDWDIALHRDDIRTNGGAALKTDKTNLADVTAIPSSGYTGDVDGQILINITNMTSTGPLQYNAKINKVLYDYITHTETGSMPPFQYAVNNLVFVVKCSDGTYAKMQLTDWKDDMNNKFVNTLRYVYPAE